jgi:hypothetical protein
MVQGYVLARPELAPTRFSVFERPGRDTGGEPSRAPEPEEAVSRETPPLSSRPRSPGRLRRQPFGRRAAGS